MSLLLDNQQHYFNGYQCMRVRCYEIDKTIGLTYYYAPILPALNISKTCVC